MSDYLFQHAIKYWDLVNNELKNGVNTKYFSSSNLKNLNISTVLLPYFVENINNYLNQPNKGFDKYIKERAKVLNISDKKLVIERIKFMINNIQKKKIDNVVKYCVL